jgi:polyferredoxin
MNDNGNIALFALLIALFAFVLVAFAFGDYMCAAILLVTIIAIVLYAGREKQ